MTQGGHFADERELASLIDHTLLKPEATENDILAICGQAIEAQFASVCVNPCWVTLVHSQLRGSNVRTCSVVGFPLGANRPTLKQAEAELAISEGAMEIDTVINIGALRSGNTDLVRREIAELTAIAHRSASILKVILETCLLSDREKRVVCELAKETGVDFVKTSTGFSHGGATEADVKLMRSIVGPQIGVKASGGVRTLEMLTRMVNAGANRIGTSSGIQIVAEYRSGSVADQAAHPAGNY